MTYWSIHGAEHHLVPSEKLLDVEGNQQKVPQPDNVHRVRDFRHLALNGMSLTNNFHLDSEVYEEKESERFQALEVVDHFKKATPF